MKKFFTNWLNPKQKDVTKWNGNYFYVTSIVFIIIIILTANFVNLPAFLEKQNSVIVHMLLISFNHNGFWHLFGNIECFVVVSLFLERHYGSLRYFGVIIGAILLSPLLDFALTNYSFIYCGESLVNFFLFGLFFVVVAFNYKDYILHKWQNLFVAIITILIILLSSFDMNMETAALKFSFLTTLLTQNHGSAFAVGVIVGIFSYIVTGFRKKEKDKG